MEISIIIPTYNEKKHIVSLLKYMSKVNSLPREIIVADGGSTDGTPQIAEAEGATVVLASGRSRALQMNEGAAIAKGDILYFLHADSYPPVNYSELIRNAISEGYSGGCFKLEFDDSHFFLGLHAKIVHFPFNCVRFGDQSLFVSKDTFYGIGGYKEELLLFEDQDIVSRIKRRGKFIVLEAPIVTSARKFREKGVYRVMLAYYLLLLGYKLGFSQNILIYIYKSLIGTNIWKK